MKKTVLVCTAMTSLVLAACTVSTDKKVSGSDFGGGFGEAKVEGGPALEGIWMSDCVRDPLSSGGYRTFRLAVTGSSFVHEEKDYSDAACSRSTTTKPLKGTLSYTKNLGNGRYRLEYRIPIDANVAALRDQNVVATGDALRVTEFFVPFDNENDAEIPSITLRKISGGSSAVTPAVPSAPAAPQPAPVTSGNLQSGLYRSADGANSCDISVSTMAVNGKVGGVYADFQSPCSQQSLEFDCNGNQCTLPDSDLLTITLVDAKSFRLVISSSNRSISYTKK